MSTPLWAWCTCKFLLCFSHLFLTVAEFGKRRFSFSSCMSRPEAAQLWHGAKGALCRWLRAAGVTPCSHGPRESSHLQHPQGQPLASLVKLATHSSFHLVIWASESQSHLCWLLLFLSQHLRTTARILKVLNFQALERAGALHENWVPALLRCFCTFR